MLLSLNLVSVVQVMALAKVCGHLANLFECFFKQAYFESRKVNLGEELNVLVLLLADKDAVLHVAHDFILQVFKQKASP